MSLARDTKGRCGAVPGPRSADREISHGARGISHSTGGRSASDVVLAARIHAGSVIRCF